MAVPNGVTVFASKKVKGAGFPVGKPINKTVGALSANGILSRSRYKIISGPKTAFV
jgi:hypothetical protein